MKNKTILVTGATGGIGGAITKLLLLLGYIIYAPVRDLMSAEKKFADFPNRHNLIVDKCDVENVAEARAYIAKLKNAGVKFERLLLAAGTLIYDHQFIEGDMDDETKKEMFKKMSPEERAPLEALSKKANYTANTHTKENIIIPYLDLYHDEVKETRLEMIGSQAAGFPIGHEWRFDEEGYCFSHVGVRHIGEEYGPRFADSKAYVAEPALIDTPMTRIKFAKNDDGTDRDWSKVMKPDEYTQLYASENGYN